MDPVVMPSTSPETTWLDAGGLFATAGFAGDVAFEEEEDDDDDDGNVCHTDAKSWAGKASLGEGGSVRGAGGVRVTKPDGSVRVTTPRRVACVTSSCSSVAGGRPLLFTAAPPLSSRLPISEAAYPATAALMGD